MVAWKDVGLRPTHRCCFWVTGFRSGVFFHSSSVLLTHKYVDELPTDIELLRGSGQEKLSSPHNTVAVSRSAAAGLYKMPRKKKEGTFACVEYLKHKRTDCSRNNRPKFPSKYSTQWTFWTFQPVLITRTPWTFSSKNSNSLIKNTVLKLFPLRMWRNRCNGNKKMSVGKRTHWLVLPGESLMWGSEHGAAMVNTAEMTVRTGYEQTAQKAARSTQVNMEQSINVTIMH